LRRRFAENDMQAYAIRPHSDEPGVDVISDVLPFGRLLYGGSDAAINAIEYAKFRSRSHDAVIRIYDAAGNVIETHKHKGRLLIIHRAVDVLLHTDPV
jgi:hypothetical protein